MRVPPVFVVATWFALQHAALADPPVLASRCEAVPWVVPAGSSDLCPPELRAIQRELALRDASVVGEIALALPASLHLRRIASAVVARWPGDATRAVLVQLLTDPDAWVAQEAASHLGEVGGREVMAPLLRAAGAAEPMVRHNALNALAAIGAATRAVDVAVLACRAAEPFVRHSAADLLARVEGPTATSQARTALAPLAAADPDQGTRAAAARALAVLAARAP